MTFDSTDIFTIAFFSPAIVLLLLYFFGFFLRKAEHTIVLEGVTSFYVSFLVTVFLLSICFFVNTYLRKNGIEESIYFTYKQRSTLLFIKGLVIGFISSVFSASVYKKFLSDEIYG